MVTPLLDALSHPRRIAYVVGWATLNWALQLLALWTIFAAFGVSMSVGVLVLGFGAANLFTALPHTPGGIGVVEVGMTATYMTMGLPTSTAVVGVVCYRLLGHWLPVVAALPLMLPHVRRTQESPLMAGVVAILGGQEHHPGCEPIDRRLLADPGVRRPSVTVLLMATVPRRIDAKIAESTGYWRALGARVRFAYTGGPDQTRDALDALTDPDLVVLTGGRPCSSSAT
jgi:hypothetical protein